MKNYPTPWQVKTAGSVVEVGDSENRAICMVIGGFGRPYMTAGVDVQTQCATLIAMAPELLKHLASLSDLMCRSDVEHAMADEMPTVTDEEWDAALEDAQFLLAMLAEEGIVAGDIQ